MNTSKLLKNILWGMSALTGFIVADRVYKAGLNAIDKRELIGDCEVISDEIEEDDRE